MTELTLITSEIASFKIVSSNSYFESRLIGYDLNIFINLKSGNKETIRLVECAPMDDIHKIAQYARKTITDAVATNSKLITLREWKKS